MEIGWLIFYVIKPLKSGSILDYQKQEFIRMLILLIIFYLISGNIVAYIYQKLGMKDSITYGIMIAISILILFTVLYRNKLQFNGWYKGKLKDKLSKKLTKWLISIALFLLLLPPILSFLSI